MNIFLAGNHSMAGSIGGSEKVLSQIAESLHKDFGYNCCILSKSQKSLPIIYNNILYENTGSTYSDFNKKIGKADHLLIYGDAFIFWKDIVLNSEKIKCSKSIALVGMNSMLKDVRLFSTFCKKQNQFKVITHSKNYIDYFMCVRNKIPVNVIPNGIDLKEFDDNRISFRNKYGILEKHIILCVSNFFPGKGQDLLVPIMKKVQEINKENIFIFVCSSFDAPFEKYLRNQFFINAKNNKINFRLLCDIPREDTIGAFNDADIFIFPTQKEVAPLVVLEAMASKTPWVSMEVGNVKELNGGTIIENQNKDVENNFIFNNEINERFSKALLSLLENKERREELAKEGREQVEKYFSFNIIAEKYNEIVTK